MHRLHDHRLRNAVAITAALAVLGTAAPAGSALAGREKQVRPQQRSRVIIEERRRHPPPPPQSSNRNYYGPAPTIQPRMQRVQPPAPLAQPPTNR